MGLSWEWDSNMSYKVNFVIVSEFDISQNIDLRCYLPIQIQTKIFLFFHPLSFANFILKPKISIQVIVWKHTYICDNWFGLYILWVVRCKGYKTRIITLFESSSSLNILKFRKMRHWHWRKHIWFYKQTFIFIKKNSGSMQGHCKVQILFGPWELEIWKPYNIWQGNKLPSIFSCIKNYSSHMQRNISWIIPVQGINFKKNLAFRIQFVWNKCC